MKTHILFLVGRPSHQALRQEAEPFEGSLPGHLRLGRRLPLQHAGPGLGPQQLVLQGDTLHSGEDGEGGVPGAELVDGVLTVRELLSLAGGMIRSSWIERSPYSSLYLSSSSTSSTSSADTTLRRTAPSAPSTSSLPSHSASSIISLVTSPSSCSTPPYTPHPENPPVRGALGPRHVDIATRVLVVLRHGAVVQEAVVEPPHPPPPGASSTRVVGVVHPCTITCCSSPRTSHSSSSEPLISSPSVNGGRRVHPVQADLRPQLTQPPLSGSPLTCQGLLVRSSFEVFSSGSSFEVFLQVFFRSSFRSSSGLPSGSFSAVCTPFGQSRTVGCCTWDRLPPTLKQVRT